MSKLTFPEFITRVPVEQRGNRCYVEGVGFFFDQPRRIPDRLYAEIDDALNAKAAASGSNMPVMLDPGLWLLRCRQCQAPFIALPSTKLCSDQCRTQAKREAAARSKAKRAEQRWRHAAWRDRQAANGTEREESQDRRRQGRARQAQVHHRRLLGRQARRLYPRHQCLGRWQGGGEAPQARREVEAGRPGDRGEIAARL